MVRYMNYAGARRKFDVDHYVFRMGVLERRMREEGAI
jgi:hypothetical protein